MFGNSSLSADHDAHAKPNATITTSVLIPYRISLFPFQVGIHDRRVTVCQNHSYMYTHIIDLDADVTLRYIEVRVGVRRYVGVYKPNSLVRGAI